MIGIRLAEKNSTLNYGSGFSGFPGLTNRLVRNIAADLADKDMNNNMSESNVNTILINPVQPDCEAVVDNHSNYSLPSLDDAHK